MIKNYNDHAANERTFLAWVRTAIAVVGFGLATARLSDREPNFHTELGLILVGGLVMVLAFLRMRVIRRLIDRPEAEPDDPGLGETLMILLIASFFVLMALFVVHIG